MDYDTEHRKTLVQQAAGVLPACTPPLPTCLSRHASPASDLLAWENIDSCSHIFVEVEVVVIYLQATYQLFCGAIWQVQGIDECALGVRSCN